MKSLIAENLLTTLETLLSWLTTRWSCETCSKESLKSESTIYEIGQEALRRLYTIAKYEKILQEGQDESFLD